jgi:hypothetical protein
MAIDPEALDEGVGGGASWRVVTPDRIVGRA